MQTNGQSLRSTQSPQLLPQPSPALSATSEVPDVPPTITHITKEMYLKQAWKNGLGGTEEIAIYPQNVDFHKDEFVWRMSLTELHDACTFSVFPGYDVAVMMLPNHAQSQSNQRQLLDPERQRHTFSSLHKSIHGTPAILRHNDQESPVPFRPLVPYTYAGELPTSCYVKDEKTKHVTFIANRNLTQVTVSLETICPHGLSDDGICDGEGDISTPIPSPLLAHPNFAKNGTDPIDRSSTPRPHQQDHLNTDGITKTMHSRNPSPSRHQSNTMPTTKILLNAVTIVFVVSGSIRASIDGQIRTIKVNEGETLICERDEDGAPTDLTMSPVIGNKDFVATDEKIKSHQDATVYIIQIHMKKLTRNGSITSSLPSLEPAAFQLNSSPQKQPPSSQQGKLTHRAGSIIIYDDLNASDKVAVAQDPVTAQQVQHHGVKYWESARHYRPPTFSARYKNESDVPPPVVADQLVIKDFPTGKISTVWINMVKQGLSEWLRVPVIVARGVNPGPVLGITAVVHGNELNGVPCIHRVITDIDVYKLNGTVVAVPCVNVPGYLRFSREFSDGKDLNRLFPGSETGTASQIYAHAILNKICIHFDYLIDLHTASFGRVNSYYVRSDLNDPVGCAMAKLQQPQIILHNSGQDGTLRSACSARGIKAITVEIGNPQWSYMGVMRIMTYFGMFPPLELEPPITTNDDTWMDPESLTRHISSLNVGSSAGGENAAGSIGNIQSNDLDSNKQHQKPIFYHQPPNTIICSRGFWIYTKTGGVLEVYPAVNTIIKKGALIARIKNIFGNIVDEIFSPSSGVTIGRSSNPVAMAGDRVLHMGVLRKENEVLQKESKENY
ncbi:hypothetical protein HK100_011657 [Physocladia obscura]|uniref:Succinylglutamate desuccinylase/Aspartoacylase catalytic domain-containing protein n=1 Tax=Physocladia obscura TaxID=109957 RepID=A0AAD5T2D1_9FUNG|nr:hypothetical protein HK100_011657 [Physocladia obscura]